MNNTTERETMNTEVVYGIFKRYVSDSSGSELPEKFEDLPERDRQNIEGLYREFILAWVDNEFKAALHDEDKVNAAARMLIMAFKVKKLEAVEALRFSMADFVMKLVNHPYISESRELMEKVRAAVEEVMKDLSSE